MINIISVFKNNVKYKNKSQNYKFYEKVLISKNYLN